MFANEIERISCTSACFFVVLLPWKDFLPTLKVMASRLVHFTLIHGALQNVRHLPLGNLRCVAAICRDAISIVMRTVRRTISKKCNSRTEKMKENLI